LNQHLLYCPITKTALAQSSDATLQTLNMVLQSEEIFTESGTLVQGPIAQLLVNENETMGYLIRHDISQLIPGLSISLQGLNTVKSVD